MDTDSFIACIKTGDNYEDIAKEIRFDTSDYDSELHGKFMTKFFGFRAKSYIYLTDDGGEDKKKQKQKSVS